MKVRDILSLLADYPDFEICFKQQEKELEIVDDMKIDFKHFRLIFEME